MGSNAGIDYGMGQTNIDKATGIRYGVIPVQDVGEPWYNYSEDQYGDAHCPRCGTKAVDGQSSEYVCPNEECKVIFDADEAFPDSPLSFTYEKDGYVMSQSGDDTDIFILKSPFYTHAQFCSPCAPGAGHLSNPTPDGPKTYCLGHDWFESGTAPYPVFKVTDDSPVEPE